MSHGEKYILPPSRSVSTHLGVFYERSSTIVARNIEVFFLPLYIPIDFNNSTDLQIPMDLMVLISNLLEPIYSSIVYNLQGSFTIIQRNTCHFLNEVTTLRSKECHLKTLNHPPTRAKVA